MEAFACYEKQFSLYPIGDWKLLMDFKLKDLTSFTKYNFFEIHSCCFLYQQFIPLYSLVVFYDMNILFIVDRYLDCFFLLL